MALCALTSALRSLSLASAAITARVPTLLPAAQIQSNVLLQLPPALVSPSYRPVHMSADRSAKFVSWKSRTKYTVKPVKMRKSGGRDHTGRIRVHGIGGGHKQNYRMIDFLRFRPEKEKAPEPFEEKVVVVRYDPCRSADIALVAGGSRKRWIIATENMKAGDTILNSNHIGRMAGGGCTSTWGAACGDPHQQRRERAWPGSPVYPSCRDMRCAASEGERDSHYPAALEEANAGAGVMHCNCRPSIQR
ncbi:mitochondrial ribosomal protein L2, isoform CRA_c [Mus musculus]|uniref:Mitochondrial ribosomal protein L2 n=1 Tax=Mus musculus TaxID=10090 RepID=B1B1D7_MOUSE|nr:mitochondrial ribosomal protein L2, isoform CRA_c [Mus musculus]